jgi:hypothetical protein
MRYIVLFSILLVFMLSACNKDKFNTTPSLKFKSVNTTQLHIGQILQFTLSFTDAEGDLTDSIYVQELVPGCNLNHGFDDMYELPSFPTTKNQQGDLVVTFGYNSSGPYQNLQPGCPPANDTATFRFALKDKAQHVSDTVSSPQIIIYN